MNIICPFCDVKFPTNLYTINSMFKCDNCMINENQSFFNVHFHADGSHEEWYYLQINNNKYYCIQNLYTDKICNIWHGGLDLYGYIKHKLILKLNYNLILDLKNKSNAVNKIKTYLVFA